MNSTTRARSRSRGKNLNKSTASQPPFVPLSAVSLSPDKTPAGGEVDIWDDPDLLNNPEKLMQLEFDDDTIEMAKSQAFGDMMQYQSEMILQDTSIMKMLKDYRNRKSKTSNNDEQLLVSRIETILAKIDKEQEEGVRLYMEAKSKPFWDPRTKQDLILSDYQREKMKEWVKTLDSFSSTFQDAISLRFRRTSMAPTANRDAEAEKLIEQLRNINIELGKAVEIFDLILK